MKSLTFVQTVPEVFQVFDLFKGRSITIKCDDFFSELLIYIWTSCQDIEQLTEKTSTGRFIMLVKFLVVRTKPRAIEAS